ncbi:MAG: hypothetical protein ACM339_00485 [Ignavibacteria bacterium]
MRFAVEKQIEAVKSDPLPFLKFLKNKFPLFHNSVFFFRDLQFGLEKFLKQEDLEASYRELEEIAEDLSMFFEENGTFIKIKDFTWKINYPEFVTQIPGDPIQ